MQVPDLRLVLQGGLAARAPGKHLRQPFEQLPLPCGHLVRMKLAPRRDRLHAVPLAQRLERYPCLELRREPPSLPGHLGASSSALESTLTTCPKNRDHLTPCTAELRHSYGTVRQTRRATTSVQRAINLAVQAGRLTHRPHIPGIALVPRHRAAASLSVSIRAIEATRVTSRL